VTRILATGFEPFGGSEVNPSQQLVEALEGQVATAVLPVVYATAANELRGAVRAAHPDIVLCFGVSESREVITIERFAHNLDEATTTDNDGAAGSGLEIDPVGPAAYPATIPVDDLVAALNAEGIAAEPSRDAGGFLCNHVFYVLMGLLEDEWPGALGGFVHVPPTLPLEELVRAGRILIAASA
jgi:pyroglutamyl-peptidase